MRRLAMPVRLALAACACVMGLTAGTPALAQSIDYSSYEQLFGEPVTTSATGKPQRASDVPANMEIITADQIRQSGADNIPDILRFIAGIDVRRYGFAAADVGVRGYNETSNPRLLVLVNGQQVYLDDLDRTQWYSLPVQLDEIRQIEVVKGPNTALFGFNAASGVINIITWDPLHDSVNTATVRAGTQDYRSLSAVGTGQIGDKAGLRVSADGFEAHEFAPTNVSPYDLPYRDSPQRAAFSLDGRAQPSPGVDIYANGAVVDTRAWEATASPYYGTDFLRTNWSRAGISADTDYGVLGLSLYRNELRYAYDGLLEQSNAHDTVYVVQASDLAKISATHTVRIELDYRNNSATSSVVLPGRVGYELYSGSLMWDWQITPDLSLTNAVRFDHFELEQHGALLIDASPSQSSFSGRSLNEPSFNSGLVWKATQEDTFRLLAARGLQLPSLYDLSVQDTQLVGNDGLGFVFLGQPSLQAASVLNTELDWDRAIPRWDSTLRLAMFAQRTDNVITGPYEATPVPVGALINGYVEVPTVAANVGSSAAVGGEIGLQGHSASGYRWKASYSFIKIWDQLSINQGGIITSPQDYQRGTPTHVVVLTGGYTRGSWEFDLQGRWQSQFTDYRGDPTQTWLVPVQVGNYVVLNARIGYKITSNLTAALTAMQFNNDVILQSAGPPIERRIFATISAHF